MVCHNWMAGINWYRSDVGIPMSGRGNALVSGYDHAEACSDYDWLGEATANVLILLGGLLKRLVYLGIGLAVLLAFIGVKLILHAMHENEVPFINGGEHIGWAPEIPTFVSLGVIVAIIVVATVASLDGYEIALTRIAQFGGTVTLAATAPAGLTATLSTSASSIAPMCAPANRGPRMPSRR
mgnify:CR=1 FL=1